MPKRRTTILGLGALAMGSGAAFTSASFENTASADADMRVLVEEQLIVEAGPAFRDGDENYDNTLDPTDGKFAGTDNSDFFDSENPSGGSNEDLGTDLGPDDTPAMFVNDGENSALAIKLATPLDNNDGDATYTFENALQVTNENIDSVEVGVKFETFGADTKGGQNSNGGDVDEDRVFDVYQFLEGTNQISASGFDAETTEDTVQNQNISGGVTLGPGDTKQIDLVVDLTAGTTREQIIQASNASGNPFTGRFDTVQLVETLQFGTLSDSQGA